MTQHSSNWGTVVAAMFLVAGTCIGGGMLALPLATGIPGFFPSLIVMVFCWIAMTMSALLLLEVTLWMEEGVHVITMTSRILGKPGRIASWILYLFIAYASIVAYTAAAGGQISRLMDNFFNFSVSQEWGCLIFLLLFGLIVDFGTALVGRINAILFMAMIAAYCAMVGLGIPEIQKDLLLQHQWSGAWLSVPLLLTAFSFQTMVPSLTPYLHKNALKLRWAIVGGTGIAFVVYAIWQGMIMGIVPVEGSKGLAASLARGEPITQFLGEHTNSMWISIIAHFFAFFAIVTSFLGITLGLFDFLSDGLHIPKKGWGKIGLGLLIVIPTLFFATQFERVFFIALDATGGFGDTILNGIMPVLMVWIGRYWLGYQGPYRLIGGKVTLILLFIGFSAAFLMSVAALFGLMPSIFDVYQLLDMEKNSL